MALAIASLVLVSGVYMGVAPSCTGAGPPGRASYVQWPRCARSWFLVACPSGIQAEASAEFVCFRVVSGKRRNEVMDARTRPEYRELHGEERAIDKPYSNGEMWSGQLDINCRGFDEFLIDWEALEARDPVTFAGVSDQNRETSREAGNGGGPGGGGNGASDGGDVEEFEPDGKPIGDALKIRGRSEDLASPRRAVNLIDGVHGDGDLPEISVGAMPRSRSEEGVYWRDFAGGRALGISVNPSSEVPVSSFLHEIGHFLDHMGLGNATSYASESGDEVLRDWATAVDETESARHLKEMAERQQLPATIRGYINDYLLTPREMFARSYYQWVAMRSGDEEVLAELASLQPVGDSDRLYLYGQWEDEAFGPVVNALDALMREGMEKTAVMDLPRNFDYLPEREQIRLLIERTSVRTEREARFVLGVGSGQLTGDERDPQESKSLRR